MLSVYYGIATSEEQIEFKRVSFDMYVVIKYKYDKRKT